jgi:hypothetical protein
MRWYMRYPVDFNWESINYDKWAYFTGETGTHGTIPEISWGDSVIATGYNSYGRGNQKGWSWINRNGKGLWHSYEAHIRMDTDGQNGVAQLWIDDELIADAHDAYYGTTQGWNIVHFLSNQCCPLNGGCVFVDVDDVKIVTEDYQNWVYDEFGNKRIGSLGASPPPQCSGCGDPAPCSSGKTCDDQGTCILLQRNEGDCDCNANCATGFCYEAGTTDYCCNPGETWVNGCKSSDGAAQTVTATLESGPSVRVVSPGNFETTFTMQKGFGHTFFDLKNDPGKQLDLAPVRLENGLLWTKVGYPAGYTSGSWYANPPDNLELLESGPARVRVRTSGYHDKWGYAKSDTWNELGFNQTFTIYPSGDVYVDYAVLADGDTPSLHHFILIIKSNGAWGPQGLDEVHPAGEYGPEIPSGNTASSFALQWSNGPTYFEDILMAFYNGKYNGYYWHEGYLDEDYRTGFQIKKRWPGYVIPNGVDHIRVLMRVADDMNNENVAALYTNDYRSPDQLSVSTGQLVTSDGGDRDGDGFNEEEGCYVLKADANGVSFILHGSAVKRMDPAFKIKSWSGPSPQNIFVGGIERVAGKDFVASVSGDTLIIQLFEDVDKDVQVDMGLQPKTCSELGGVDCCTGTETCGGTAYYGASDCSGVCCTLTCSLGTPCGDGNCDSGECNTCPQDCTFSQCCPDGDCNNQETCSTCPQDCGSCPAGEFHWLEAGYPATINSPMQIDADASASEGQYIHVPNGAGTGGETTYSVSITEPGDYILWGRTLSPDGNNDSFFMEVDTSGDKLWDLQDRSGSWVWDKGSDRGTGTDQSPEIDPVVFSLSAGAHTIKVKQREDGTKLDKLLLTNDLGYTPSGLGEPAENIPGCGDLTCDPGETCSTCPGDCPCSPQEVCCNGQCVSGCIDGDGCCPPGCTYASDNDCPGEVVTETWGDVSGSDYPGTVEDTFINLNYDNYADSEILATYTLPANKIANAILIKWDLSALQGNVIVQYAKLQLYLNSMDLNGGDNPYDVGVHRMINYNPDITKANGYTYDGVNGWTPNDCCYNNIPMAQADITAAEDTEQVDKILGYREWDVINMVKHWLSNPSENFGMLINSDPVASSDSYRYFASSENVNVDQRPKLVVTYSLYHRADTNKNSCIDLGELMDFIKRWKISSKDVPMAEIMGAIGLWNSGTGC